ncbi:alpha/beta hydrolase [Streptomyces sp. NPDC001941]|uniref:alpha/beta hydrolase n=1 Tax=Streptomyces sp. NPDC001941 TaxID=3154659 RepID=UPI003329B6BF
MKKRAGVLIGVATLTAGLLSALPSAAQPRTDPLQETASSLKWTPCPTDDYPRLECSSVRVPLDHDAPRGQQITLALSRVAHTAKTYQGPLLVNPGGPGASGLTLAGFVAASLPAATAAQYDVIGFDPRGVGKSSPALDCVPGYFDPVRPASVPLGARDERTNRARAASFAAACGKKYGSLLRHIDTLSTARDLDSVRKALGARKINYFGYSYGTYLGAVYARLFPERVRRLVLDSVVDPRGVWYDDNLSQDLGFDARQKAFLAWTAKYDSAYHLGTDPAKVEAKWYAMQRELRARPAGGVVGAAELEDTFLPGGYYNGYWPYLAEAFAAYANGHDTAPLVDTYRAFAAIDASGDNGYSVYAAVQCRDARWPRDWDTWREDNQEVYKKAPFTTWNNAWYNAPCATWPVGSLKQPGLANRELPPVLLFQATDDPATPYPGGVAVHRLLRGSSLVVEQGGGNHAITLGGNACLDRYLAQYLDTGKVPRGSGHGDADAVCAKVPDPTPAAPSVTKAAGITGAATGGAALHGLLGFTPGS